MLPKSDVNTNNIIKKGITLCRVYELERKGIVATTGSCILPCPPSIHVSSPKELFILS